MGTGLALGLALAGAATAAPGDKAIDLPGDRLFPESVSITADGTAYVGSMAGGVLRVSMRTGKAEQWIAPGAYGTGAEFGVLADKRNGIVWTCSNEFTGSALSVPGADPGHWLKGFDIRTGTGKVSLRLPGEKPVCNDMAVGRDGSVYITDTGQPRILRWHPGATELEIWLEDPQFGPEPNHGGLDGIAFGADGNLYVNNVRTGAFYRVVMGKDGKPDAVTALTLSRPLSKPDGMRPIGGLDFAVAEGEGRIAKLSVQGDSVTVTTLAEGIVQPTGVDVHGGRVWYVQGQLGGILNPAKNPQPQLPFRLTPVALKP
jgi:sugar lactone lactonase YvrE